MSLFLDIAVGDILKIGKEIQISLKEKSGKRSRLKIDAPKDLKIKIAQECFKQKRHSNGNNNDSIK